MSGHALFTQQDANLTFSHYLSEMQKEINEKSNDYILNVNAEEWLAYFINKYDFQPLEVYPDKATIKYTGKPMKSDGYAGRQLDNDAYIFDIEVPFTGWFFLFMLKPSSCILNDFWVTTPSIDSGNISTTLTIRSHDDTIVERRKISFFNALTGNIPYINSDLARFKASVAQTFNEAYSRKKEKVLSEKSFFERLNINIENSTDKIFKVPIIEKKEIPEPKVDKRTSKIYDEVPTLPDNLYYDIIDVVNTFFKSVEKKPSTYLTKDEEALRDYVLPVLETRYSNVTVTGETFNKGGKTDILIRYIDGTNLFVAECKFWKGEALFHETINQLFDRYLTWRDSKTAILFFVKNKELSKVLKLIEKSVKVHPYFVRPNGRNGETSTSYIFHFPSDKGKHIFTEIMAFHFPDI